MPIASESFMHPTSAFKILPALVLATLMAACGSTAPMPPAPLPSNAAQQLQAYDWDLAAAYDGRGQAVPSWQLAGRPAARLHFEGNRVAVQNLCNVVGAGYTLNGDRVQVSHPMSTKRACADRELMQLEQQVATQLPQAQRYELRGGGAAPAQLVLHFTDGSRWELAGAPTPATRYGAAGEQVFLEVAPERVACHHPLMPNAQCLRVRDLRYGDNGIKQSVGEWRFFYGEIEGYQHERGIRNVLRLQRYSLAKNGQLPADAPSHAYVLDMVVESERVR